MKQTPRNRVRGLAELPASRVEGSAKNWKLHGIEQRNRMAGLLGAVGSVSELVVWVPDAEARAALRQTSNPEGFAAWLAGFTGKVRMLDGHMRKGLRGKRIGVQVTDLDDAEAALVLATFDPIGAQAGRDDAILRELLEGQRYEDNSVEDMLAELRASVGEGPKQRAEPDRSTLVEQLDDTKAEKWADAPSPSAEDVIAGRARWALIEGDSLIVLPSLPAASIDALITDLPYSSGGAFRGDRAMSTTTKYVTKYRDNVRAEFAGDNRDQRSFITWCAMWLAHCQRLLKPGAPVCLFSDWRQLPAVTDALQAGGFVWRGIAVWDKTRGVRPQKGRFAAQCEYVVWGSNGAMPLERGVDCLPGCFTVSVRQADKHHQTGKPTDLMRQINAITKPGGIILDAFAGSNSTGAAALLDGYRVISVEKTAAYAPTARGRMAFVERSLSAEAA